MRSSSCSIIKFGSGQQALQQVLSYEQGLGLYLH